MFTFSRRGKFYVMDVFSSKTGRLLSPKMIKKQLEKIVEMAGGLLVHCTELHLVLSMLM